MKAICYNKARPWNSLSRLSSGKGPASLPLRAALVEVATTSPLPMCGSLAEVSFWSQLWQGDETEYALLLPRRMEGPWKGQSQERNYSLHPCPPWCYSFNMSYPQCYQPPTQDPEHCRTAETELRACTIYTPPASACGCHKDSWPSSPREKNTFSNIKSVWPSIDFANNKG